MKGIPTRNIREPPRWNDKLRERIDRERYIGQEDIGNRGGILVQGCLHGSV